MYRERRYSFFATPPCFSPQKSHRLAIKREAVRFYIIMKRALSGIVLTLSLLVGMLFTGCIDDSFSTDPSHVLTFSTDTIAFDTVFTDIGTATRSFRIYNPNKKSLNITSIKLADAEHSGFLINVDGMSGSEFNDVEIRGKDSLFVFVEANINPTDRDNPIFIVDSIVFLTNGVKQDVKLTAYGQDVIIKRGETLTADTRFTANRPYLVYDSLVVAQGATLTLDPGTRLHFHNKATLLVQGKLLAEGERDNLIHLRGDRLDRLFADLPYDNLGGQWGGIHFYAESTGNRIVHAHVRGMSSGIVIDSCSTEEPRLEILNSRIRNSSGNLITSSYSRLICQNSELSDAAGAILALTGGIAQFTHCTIVNYYFYDIITSPIINLNYCAVADSIPDGEPLLRAQFNNSIICGTPSELSKIEFKGSHVFFRNCMLRSNGSDDENFIQTVWSGKPYFVATGEEHYYYNYQIGNENSSTIGMGDPAFAIYPLDTDMLGNPRTTRVDIGAYQYAPQEKGETE